MPAGRPRTSSPTPDECVKLGEELVEWATEETKEWRCLFQQWYSIKKGILRKDWKALVQIPQFLPYYEIAQAALAKKAIDGTMEKSFGQRYVRLYDRGLIEVENEQAIFDADLKKIEEKDKERPITINIVDFDPKKKVEVS